MGQAGSLEPFQQHQSVIRKALEYFESQLNPATGLLNYDHRFWLFLDWTNLHKEGCSTELSQRGYGNEILPSRHSKALGAHGRARHHLGKLPNKDAISIAGSHCYNLTLDCRKQIKVAPAEADDTQLETTLTQPTSTFHVEY